MLLGAGAADRLPVHPWLYAVQPEKRTGLFRGSIDRIMSHCFHNRNTDPAFNLAAEEYLLRQSEEDVFMLWRNEPSIIIGRNQNALAEVDLPFVEASGLQVVRRLSGGGAVYHDLGNVNFTFIQSRSSGPRIEFERYTDPIVDALAEMGLAAKFEGRNDLTLNGRKISGNAQFLHKNRVLHHGTLLFSSDLTVLGQALKVDPAKFQDKAVKSIASRVTNIVDHLPYPISVERFIERILAHRLKRDPAAAPYHWQEADLESIESLRRSRYGSWEWNFGRSPDYAFQRKSRTSGGTLEIHLQVEEGRVERARILGDFLGLREIREIEEALAGVRHDPEAIRSRLEGFELAEFVQGVPLPDFVAAFF